MTDGAATIFPSRLFLLLPPFPFSVPLPFHFSFAAQKRRDKGTRNVPLRICASGTNCGIDVLVAKQITG